MNWIPPNGKQRKPEFPCYFGGHISEKQDEKVNQICHDNNISRAELLRSVLDYAFENKEE